MPAGIQSSWWHIYDSWPIDRVEEFDRMIDQFESVWHSGRISEIDSVLKNVPESERAVWLSELLAIEIVSRWGRGEHLTIDKIQHRFPNDTKLVQQVWTEISPAIPTVLTQRENSGDSSAQGSCFQNDEILDGRYQIQRCVKIGGMAEMYRAVRIVDRLPFAVKVFKLGAGNLRHEMQLEQRFVEEAFMLHGLRHPHLLTAIEIIRRPGRPPAIVMDWIEGLNFADQISLHGPMSWTDSAKAILQAAEGLGWAWRKFGLVHRDIKPHNLMLKPDGDVVVLDFGLARIDREPSAAGERFATSAAETFGTPDFAAPEQTDEARKATATADVYGLGCTLFFLISGVAPYSFGAAARVPAVEAHRRLPPPDIRALYPDVPIAFATLIQRMLAKDPAERPPDANAVANELRQCMADPESKAQPENPTSQRPPAPGAHPYLSNLLQRLDRRTLMFVSGLLVIAGAIRVWTHHPNAIPRVLEFQTLLFRLNDPKASLEQLGEIGRTKFAAQSGNLSQVQARFDSAVHATLISVDGQGRVKRVMNSAEDNNSQPGKEWTFPAEGLWKLEEIGFHALILIASRDPLPPFTELQTAIASSGDWRKMDGLMSVWQTKGSAIQPLIAKTEEPRDHVVLIVPEPMKQVHDAVRRATRPGSTIEIIAFPVVE